MATRTLEEIQAYAEGLAAQYKRDVAQHGYRERQGDGYRRALERYIGNLGAYEYETLWAIRKIQTDMLMMTTGTKEGR